MKEKVKEWLKWSLIYCVTALIITYGWQGLELLFYGEVQHRMVAIEYMDDYISDIEYRILSGMLPPEDMRIVERYKEYKQHEHGLKMVDFKKLMNMLIG